MATRMNIEELKTLIANEIKNEGLNGVLPEDAIDRIKEKIMAKKQRDAAHDIPEVVSELDVPALQLNTGDRKFPDDRAMAPSPEQQVNMSGETGPAVHVDAGAAPTETMSEPKMGYTPELPDMLKKADPAELIVFQYNDIGESGENLSYKPMRTMDDPDVKKSMQDLWVEQGKTRANVYVAKFEKIGEIEFDYTDGTSQFHDTSSTPDHVGGTEYKDNPYEAPSLPQIDDQTQGELETYIKSSVDLEKVVHDIVMGIVKDSLLTNTEKAVNDETIEVSEDIVDYGENRENNGYNVAQSVKPMEESTEPADFSLSMKEIAEGNKYQKITLPEGLNEAIKSGDKTLLAKENDTMQQWEFEDKTYYTPINRLSKTKGYVKS